MQKHLLIFGFLIFSFSLFSQTPPATKSQTTTAVVVSDQARLKEVVKTFSAYIKALHELNFTECRKYLADHVNSMTSDTNLETLSKNINRNDELVVFNQNMQFQDNGNGPVLIEFKYKSQTEAPEIFTVSFDKDNKITGFNSSNPKTNAR